MSSIRLGPLSRIEAPAFRALVTVIRQLITGSSFRTLEELGRKMAGHPDKRRLSELSQGARFPERHEVHALVKATGGDVQNIEKLYRSAEAERSERIAKVKSGLYDHLAASEHHRLPIVSEFKDWIQLGVHRQITLLTDEVDHSWRVDKAQLPAYVLREKDVEPGVGLRPLLAQMASDDSRSVRLVLITGESAAGKTRAAVEGMRTELSTWRLLVPHSADSLRRLLDIHLPLRHVVVWLDEVQELLQDAAGPEQLKRLLALNDGPTVLLATIRTDAERSLKNTSAWRLLDRHAYRIVLRRRAPKVEFDREISRATKLDDPWISEALSKIQDRYGIAEWLAAGPQLVRELDRSRTSSDPIERTASAIVDAAVDCYRAGYTSPVPEALLIESHRLYLDFFADGQAFAHALTLARHPICGASAPLEHHPGWGDRAFDYLLGHGSRTSADPIPDQLWSIVLRHMTPSNMGTVTRAAVRAGAHDVVAQLVDRASRAAHSAADNLRGFVYSKVDDVDALTRLADEGDEVASEWLCDLLLNQGDRRTLTERADRGDDMASLHLAGLLEKLGDIDALEERVAAGDWNADMTLAELYLQNDDIDSLTRLANSGSYAQCLLPLLLFERGEVDALTRRADAGEFHAANKLATLLVERDDFEMLLYRADAGDNSAEAGLAELLLARDDRETLVEYADAGRKYAAWRLGELLHGRGDQEGLTQRADQGDGWARNSLASLLVQRGDLRTLTQRAYAGDYHAVDKLVLVLEERGDVAALDELADHTSSEYARISLARLLGERGEIETLIGRADDGDERAAEQLANRLIERGDAEALYERANMGDSHAETALDRLLASRGL